MGRAVFLGVRAEKICSQICEQRSGEDFQAGEVRHSQRSGLLGPCDGRRSKAQEQLCPRTTLQTSYAMVIRRLQCLKARSRNWRSQDIPGRLSLKVGSSVGAGVGRWWRAATGCDPSALIRRALRAGISGRNGACLLGSSRTQSRGAPPVALPWSCDRRLKWVLPGQIDCLIAHLSADAETRNPRPNIVWPVGPAVGMQ